MKLTAVKFIAAIEPALAQLGPVHAVIGHSMGGAMSLYSVAIAEAPAVSCSSRRRRP